MIKQFNSLLKMKYVCQEPTAEETVSRTENLTKERVWGNIFDEIHGDNENKDIQKARMMWEEWEAIEEHIQAEQNVTKME